MHTLVKFFNKSLLPNDTLLRTYLEKRLVTPDHPNHGTTSLDVMTAKAEIFGFLAVEIYLLKLMHR